MGIDGRGHNWKQGQNFKNFIAERVHYLLIANAM